MQQPPYQQQPMYQPPPPPPPLPPNYPGKQMLTISVICGAASLALGSIFSLLSVVNPVVGAIMPALGLLASIVGLIAAVMGSNQAKRAGIQSGMATAGLILSILAMVWCLIFTIACSCTACVWCAGQKVVSDANDFFSNFTFEIG